MKKEEIFEVEAIKVKRLKNQLKLEVKKMKFNHLVLSNKMIK